MTTRRSFIGACLAGFAAPAIVRAEILMPVRKIIVPQWPNLSPDKVAAAEARIRDILFPDDGYWSDPYVACIDTWRPGGGIDRKWIPASEFYKPPEFQTIINGQRRPDLDARLRKVREHLQSGQPLPWRSI